MNRVAATLLIGVFAGCTTPTEETPAAVTIAPRSPELIDWACPPGWTVAPGLVDQHGQAIALAEIAPFTICHPPPQLDCPVGEAQFLGETTCRLIGTVCPPGDWLDEAQIRELAADFAGAIRYVRPGAAGSGTQASPFGQIATALAGASDGDIIALAQGTYTEAVRINRSVALLGACVSGTTIFGPDLYEYQPTIELTGSLAVALLGNVRVSGDRPGIGIDNYSGVARVRGVEVLESLKIGVVAYDGGTAELDELVVRHTGSWAATGGWGIGASGASQITIDGALLELNRVAGLIAYDPESVINARGVIVRDTQPQEATGNFGFGVEVFEGAQISLTQALVEGNLAGGCLVRDATSQLTLTDAVIRDTAGQQSDGHYGDGLNTYEGGTALLSRVLFDANRKAAISADDSGSLVIATDVVARNTGPMVSGQNHGFGIGIQIALGAALQGTRVVVEHNTGVGVGLLGGTGQLRDLVVHGTQSAALGEGGMGLVVDGGGLANIDGALFVANRSEAISLFDPETSATFSNLVVRDTLSREATGRMGAGLVALSGPRVTVIQAVFEHNRDVSLVAGGPGAHLLLRYVAVLHTEPAACAELPEGSPGSCVVDGATIGGAGIVAVAPATIDIENFNLGHHAFVGVQIMDGGHVRAAHGEIHHCVVGMNIEAPDYDMDSIEPTVSFHDNELRVDAATLPLPDLGEELDL